MMISLKVSSMKKLYTRKCLNLDLDAPAEKAEKARLVGHKGHVSSVAMSQDVKWAVSGGDDGIIRLWNIANRSLHLIFIPFGFHGGLHN